MADNFIRYGFQKESLWIDSASVYISYALDTTSKKIAFIFTAEESCNIDTVALRVTSQIYGFVSGSYKVGIAGFSNGVPTTYLGNAYTTISNYTNNAVNGKIDYHTWSTNNAYAATKGETLAILVEYNTGTIDASNSTTFTIGNNAWFLTRVFPFYMTYSGAAWSRSTIMPIYGYGTSGSKMYGNLNSDPVATTSTSSGNKIAAVINMPTGTCNSYKIGGIQYMLGGIDTGNDTYHIRLWDTSENVLQSITLDTDFQSGSSSRGYNTIWFDKNSLATLSPNTTYYLGIEYVSGTALAINKNIYNRYPSNVDYGIKANNRNYLYMRYGDTISTGTDELYNSPYIYPIITDIS